VRMLSASRLIVSLALIAVLLTACSRDPNLRKQKYLQSGQLYFENGKYREAAIEFVNALKIDPNYADAHYQLAESYIKTQQWQRAYQELVRAVDLQPKNYPAHVEIAKLLIAMGSFQQAQEQIDLLLQEWPNEPRTHFINANLLAAEAHFPSAIQEIQKAIALDPGDWDLYLNLALMQTKDDQSDAAELNFKKAVDLNPKAMNAHLMLASYYQSRSRFAEAEQQLRAGIQVDPKNPDPRAALARLYVAEDKKPEAEEFLRQSKRDFPDDSTGYRMLGDFYFVTGDLDKAIAEYGVLYQQHPKDLQVKKNYIELLILNNRVQEARQLNEEILKGNPNDTEALIYRGQLQIRAGDANGATTTLQTVVKNDPGNGLAHYHLGVGFQQSGNLESAESEYREAVRLRPDLVDAQRALALLAMRKGDMTTLEQAATQMIDLRPTSPDGYALRAISYINRKQFATAEGDARKAIEVGPQSQLGFVQMGNLKFVQKQYPDAATAYQEALDRDPNSIDALRGLMNTYVAQKRTDDAVAAANAQIAKSPSNSGFYDLLGTALFYSKKDPSGAEEAFEKSVALDKHNSDALLKFCQVRAAKGRIDDAIATAQQALKDNPREPNLYVMMGRLYESKSDWKQAEDAYRNALTLNSQDPLASNSLAKAMLETGGNLDVALSLAQTARRGLPDSPSVADNLAWIYYQKGAYQSAIGLLQEALKLQEKNKMPDNADIHYHLGMAYEKTDHAALARQHLEQVLKINPNYRDAAEVKKQLTGLKS
jgi:tetratricopeptide (TPR) repeat protein